MQKADLHVHSRYSDHPSEWFLQRLGAAESYTDPEAAYDAAIGRGMDFVTVTDHNCLAGALELQARHPERVLPGVETTTYFPEDGCKIHLLIYGLDEREFGEVETRRGDIYALRDYVRDAGLAHSVAHATYSVNDRLTSEHLEKLILLFDVFEGQNGARDELHNEGWTSLLRELTREEIGRLRARHRIEPISRTPWVKGFTGGSDDHAGLFIGKTYTLGRARTPREFLECLRDKRTLCGGANSDYRALAFSIYKVAYDFAKSKSQGATPDFLGRLSSYLFEQDRMGLVARLRLAQYKKRADSTFDRLLAELVERLQDNQGTGIEARLELVYDHVAHIVDEILRSTIEAVGGSLREGNLSEVCKTLSLAMPGILLTVPFLSAFRHLHANKQALRDLRATLGRVKPANGKQVLWFTDTLTDLNGVATTLQEIGWAAHHEGRALKLVTSLLPEEMSAEVPPNVVNLPASYHFSLPYYESLTMKVPSVLACLKELFSHNPDEICISSPGPLGLLGLLMGRLLGAPCTGIYHTDFAAEIGRLTGDESVAGVVEAYTRWFYSLCRDIQVPSHEYATLLETRGFDRSRMVIFPRGIDTDLFAPRNGAARERLRLPQGVTLVYAGRLSNDKSVGFLADVYAGVAARRDDINLVVVGDGPDLPGLRARFDGNPRVALPGRVAHAALPDYYAAGHLFVFPSATDTFGMAVMEAQACGLPALVSDVGGPQEIIQDGLTGWRLPADDSQRWATKILEIADLIHSAPDDYREMRRRARRQIQERFAWAEFMRWLFNDRPAPSELRPPPRPARPKLRAMRPAVQLPLFQAL